MSISIYNTMTRRKEPFVPAEPGKLKMYVCGPTVYDYIHIGNARPLIFFDVVRRYFAYAGYEVRYVVNFTDVDDKLIRKAAELGLSVPEVADKYIGAYYQDTEALGVGPADIHPRVTEHIPEIVSFIQELVDKEYAYERGGDVYFRTARFADYGKLSHQKLQELQFGIRIEVDERKENPQDFVLWKKAKEGEISWPSPWGAGRPGWHIECSAMSKKYLGETLDIHGGGHDLQFPHHECEVAQSEALHGKPLARYWMHNGYIHIDNEKMSKSLGNGILVRELAAQYRPQALRFFMLSAHYRNPLNFTVEVMTQAENSLSRLDNCAGNARHRLAALGAAGTAETDAEGAEQLLATLSDISAAFRREMEDDFNTPDAITAMFELASAANLYMQRDSVSEEGLKRILGLFAEMDGVLGILTPEEEPELPDADIDRLLEERTEARKAKNWARADEIRDLLTGMGIILEDTPQGLRWRRK